MPVKAETKLKEILIRPEAAQILQEYGVPCLNCPLGEGEIPYLTLGQVAEFYGLDLEGLLQDLNQLESGENKKLIIYCDGGARGNPGPAALGVAIYRPCGELIREISKFLGEKTNNQAEYLALIEALKQARELGGKDLQIILDSQLVVRQLKGEYRIRNHQLQQLAQKVKELEQNFTKVTFEHRPREENRHADTLVNQALNMIK